MISPASGLATIFFKARVVYDRIPDSCYAQRRVGLWAKGAVAQCSRLQRGSVKTVFLTGPSTMLKGPHQGSVGNFDYTLEVVTCRPESDLPQELFRKRVSSSRNRSKEYLV